MWYGGIHIADVERNEKCWLAHMMAGQWNTYIQTDIVRQHMLVIIHTHPQVCTTCSTAYQHLVHITCVCMYACVSRIAMCRCGVHKHTCEHKWARYNRSSLSLEQCQSCPILTANTIAVRTNNAHKTFSHTFVHTYVRMYQMLWENGSCCGWNRKLFFVKLKHQFANAPYNGIKTYTIHTYCL